MLEKLPKYSVWFDFIRACAALAVFIGHARVLFLSSIVAEIGLATFEEYCIAPGKVDVRKGLPPRQESVMTPSAPLASDITRLA